MVQLRLDRRKSDELRPVRIIPGYLTHAEGSVLIESGDTRVLCSVSVEERTPSFLSGTGKGWITAEYGMLPRSTHIRTPRSGFGTGPGGRIMEIQRLIGRSLRAVTDQTLLGMRTFMVDCDVIQADGGTRTLAVTGAYVALYEAFQRLNRLGVLQLMPFTSGVAAVSVGVVDGVVLLDLCYEEDSRAETDFNVVMTDKGDFVEIQGTAEHQPFSRKVLDELLVTADKGIQQLFETQHRAIKAITN